jgi:hypothetical protein
MQAGTHNKFNLFLYLIKHCEIRVIARFRFIASPVSAFPATLHPFVGVVIVKAGAPAATSHP